MTFQAGCKSLQVPDPTLDIAFPLYLFYPTKAATTPTNLGPYHLDVAMQAPLVSGNHRLILISHGSGGSPLVYRLLAIFLAQQGFVVACPEHPHNNRSDNSWEATLNNLEHRPRHLQLALDAVSNHPQMVQGLATCVAQKQIGIIGHSMGGYAALALAGGAPHTQHQQPALPAQPVAVPQDPRIGALVLLAPATVWFAAPGNLDNVSAPTLLISGGEDTQIPPWQMALLSAAFVPGVLRAHQQEPNAGHYSFLSPFPAAMAVPGFLPAQDPPGFDRDTFLAQLNQSICAFFTQHLLG